MALQEQELAQVRPPGTSAVPAYSPGVGETGIISHIQVSNVHTGNIKYSIFKDNDGTDADESTSMIFESVLKKGQTFMQGVWWPMNNPAGTLSVQVDVANGANFTFHGSVRT